MPHWRLKAALQWSLAQLPYGDIVHYGIQRATNSLPIGTADLTTGVLVANEYVRWAETLSGSQVGNLRFLEFGSGWDLHLPLSLYSLGVETQATLDLYRLVRPYLLDCVVTGLQGVQHSSIVRRPPSREPRQSVDDYLRELGITYYAPSDAREMPFGRGSADVVTSTHTMEHIPPSELRDILRECCRVLNDTGFLMSQIDYQDHYAYFDKKLSPYNFLGFSESRWAKYNNRFLYQNRLRHQDYLKLLRDTGFEIVGARVASPTDGEVDELYRKNFGGWDHAREIGIKAALIVASPRQEAAAK